MIPSIPRRRVQARDPAAPEPLMTDMARGESYVDNRQVVRGTSGNGLLIGAVIVILAAVAFYIFGPGAGETVAPPSETPATTTAPAPAASPTLQLRLIPMRRPRQLRPISPRRPRRAPLRPNRLPLRPSLPRRQPAPAPAQ